MSRPARALATAAVRPGARPTAWWPQRRLYALLALVTAVLTTTLLAWLGGPPWLHDLALLYVALVAVALLLPAAITVQVVAGQLLVVGALLGGTADLVSLAVVVAGVVSTAELLAVVARLDAPVERTPTGDLSRTLVAALVGAAAYAGVSLVAGVPGPRGLAAVLLASAACAVIGIALVRR